jgi:hypothetical protein
VAVRREQHEACVGARDAQLDPALLAHWLVGGHRQTHLVAPESQGTILIADGDAGEFDTLDHVGLLARMSDRGKSWMPGHARPAVQRVPWQGMP